MMGALDSLALAFWALAAGAAVTAVTGRYRRASGWIAFAAVVIASAAVVKTGAYVFRHGPLAPPEPLFEVGPLGAALLIRVDYVSLLFLAVICFLGLWAALFSVDYMLGYQGEDLRRYYPFFLLFLAGMMGVVVVADMFFFFIFWEVMTLASYLLVVFEKDSPVNLRAGLKYFLMTHIATALMFVAAIILYLKAGRSFDFVAMRRGLESLLAAQPALAHLVLFLFLIGFGTKAGIFPLGDWLPDAHPAAPSGVSALLSGVMIKMGVYGLLRVFVWMLPISHASLGWGFLIALAGVVSMFVGNLTALAQNDSKRMLAFSSIGQMGYIWLALGMGIAFLPISPPIACVALLAGLYHLVNHACFKGLLFLSAGAILFRARTRSLALLGGLGKLMPLTAAAALIASLAIAGVPPLNGFASKWLILQTTMLGGMDVPIYVVFGLVAFFISIVSLAVYVKFLGSTFLGKLAEGLAADPPREVPATMQVSQGALAVACIGLGLAPAGALAWLHTVLPSLKAASYWPKFAALFGTEAGWGNLLSAVRPNLGEGAAGAWYPLAVVLVLVGGVALAHLIYHAGGARARLADVWYCGEAHSSEETRYPAHSYYLPFKEFLRVQIGARRTSGVYPHLPLPRVKEPAFARRALDLDSWLYNPLVRWGGRVLERFSRTHVGIPQVYVLWMAVGTVLAIWVLFALSR
jgi:hydrogenase-4 component B